LGQEITVTGLATYHSTKRVKAGEIIRVHPDTNACVVRAEDGGEIRVPLRPNFTTDFAPQIGEMYLEHSDGGSAVCSLAVFNSVYASRASNL